MKLACKRKVNSNEETIKLIKEKERKWAIKGSLHEKKLKLAIRALQDFEVDMQWQEKKIVSKHIKNDES